MRDLEEFYCELAGEQFETIKFQYVATSPIHFGFC